MTLLSGLSIVFKKFPFALLVVSRVELAPNPSASKTNYSFFLISIPLVSEHSCTTLLTHYLQPSIISSKKTEPSTTTLPVTEISSDLLRLELSMQTTLSPNKESLSGIYLTQASIPTPPSQSSRIAPNLIYYLITSLFTRLMPSSSTPPPSLLRTTLLYPTLINIHPLPSTLPSSHLPLVLAAPGNCYQAVSPYFTPTSDCPT